MQVADDPGRLEDRAPTLLRLHAGMRRTPGDGDAQVEDALARRDDVAVRTGAFEHERRIHVPARARGCAGVEVGEPISSSGFATKTSRSKGSPPSSTHQRLERVQPGQQAALHVGHARSAGEAVGDDERSVGGGPRIEHRVEVADQQDPRRASTALEGRHHRVADAAGRVRPALDRRAETAQELGGPASDLVDAIGGVAAAIDVDEALEVAR